MKKTLTYSADRSQFLSLRNLSDFAADAEALGISEYAEPKIVAEGGSGSDKGRVKKITVERQVY